MEIRQDSQFLSPLSFNKLESLPQNDQMDLVYPLSAVENMQKYNQQNEYEPQIPKSAFISKKETINQAVIEDQYTTPTFGFCGADKEQKDPQQEAIKFSFQQQWKSPTYQGDYFKSDLVQQQSESNAPISFERPLKFDSKLEQKIDKKQTNEINQSNTQFDFNKAQMFPLGAISPIPQTKTQNNYDIYGKQRKYMFHAPNQCFEIAEIQEKEENCDM